MAQTKHAVHNNITICTTETQSVGCVKKATQRYIAFEHRIAKYILMKHKHPASMSHTPTRAITSELPGREEGERCPLSTSLSRSLARRSTIGSSHTTHNAVHAKVLRSVLYFGYIREVDNIQQRMVNFQSKILVQTLHRVQLNILFIHIPPHTFSLLRHVFPKSYTTKSPK